MKDVVWNKEKNAQLMEQRGITFEQLLSSRFIGLENNPSKSHQRLMLFEFQRYVWVVPYVEDEKYYFLKTAFPSRKHTKKYLKGGE